MNTPMNCPTVDSQRLRMLVEQTDNLCAMPHAALRIIEVVHDDRSGASELKAALEADVALSARVLRCVNSSAYALRSKVTNLERAIACLGFQRIRNLAITASMCREVGHEVAIGPFRAVDLWRHLVSVGICARFIAMRRRIVRFEDAFLAGLMHDIGIAVEHECAPEPFAAMMQSLDTGRSLAENETAVLGFDHRLLGEQLALSWQFPDVVVAAIRHHHDSLAYTQADAEVVRCVEAANILCTLKGIASVGVNLLRPSRDVFDSLELRLDDVEVLLADLDDELARHSDLLVV